MNRQTLFNIIALVSTTGILCWMMTDYFGGMTIYLVTHGTIIILLAALFIFSFFETIISTIKRGFRSNKIKVVSHGLVLSTILLTILFQSELLKANRVLTATLKDDLFHYTLVLRDNGTCENEVSGAFGYEEVFHGKYKLHGDTIIFSKKPYDNNFIPDTLLVVRSSKAIFIDRNKSSDFDTAKKWLNHFEIE